MPRLAVVLLSTAVAACEQSANDRIDELEDAVTVDCGIQDNQAIPVAEAQLIVSCMNDARAADVRAKAVIDYEIDCVSRIFTVDGAFVNIEGFTDSDDTDFYDEYRCATFAVRDPSATTTMVELSDCKTIRQWR